MGRRVNRQPETLKGALGHHLMLSRMQAGYKTQADLAEAIGNMTKGPIEKVEAGERIPSSELFERWLHVCGVTGQLAEVLQTMYHLARVKDDPQAYQAAPWEEIEGQARWLMYWELTLVPGLLQTEDYARHLFLGWRNSAEKVKELTGRRLKRRAVLTKDDAPDVVVVIWERALYTLVGSPEVMAAQLDLLLELSDLPNVFVHILPAGAPAGMGMAGPVSIAVTDAGEAVLMEGPDESAVASDTAKVKLAESIFNSVRALVKDAGDSRTIITEAMETWKERAGASPRTAAPRRETASS